MVLLLFSRSVVSNSLRPHELQQARFPCPSLSPAVCSNSCLLSQWCYLTILSSVTPFSSCPQIFPSIRVFSSESTLPIRWPKYWSFSFSISPSSEYSGLISFRIDWFDLFAVQGTLKNLLQHHNSKASILWHSVFFIVQLSHPYMTTGKTIALTIQTFVSKVMSLLVKALFRFVITFLPGSKHLLISWLQSPSAVVLEPKKIKSVPVSAVSFCRKVVIYNLHTSSHVPLNHSAAAAAAKSLQSCPTLCDPIDGSPPVSPVLGTVQARTLEWVAISFSNAWKWKVKVKSLSPAWLLATLWTAAYQAFLPMGFSRQEYWSGLPLPSPLNHSRLLIIPNTMSMLCK